MEKDMWFQLRVHCMDAYVLSHILKTKKPLILYYAGASHTRNITRYLLHKKLATVLTSTSNSAWKKLSGLCNRKGITHCTLLKLPHAELMIAGERHDLTEKSFASELVDVLRQFCDTTSILFLIEKHISNKRDAMQCDLMCNQPTLALHASRCDSFVESEHVACQKLDILAVDNRHTDMGFLRVELMDLWDDSTQFRKVSQEFQRSALLSMYNFCSTLLLCNELRYGE